jgi:hypothetical protein
MTSDNLNKNYADAVEAFHAAEPRWRKRMLELAPEDSLGAAEAAKETVEMERLFNQMQIFFRAFMTARRPKC